MGGCSVTYYFNLSLFLSGFTVSCFELFLRRAANTSHTQINELCPPGPGYAISAHCSGGSCSTSTPARLRSWEDRTPCPLMVLILCLDALYFTRLKPAFAYGEGNPCYGMLNSLSELPRDHSHFHPQCFGNTQKQFLELSKTIVRLSWCRGCKRTAGNPGRCL